MSTTETNLQLFPVTQPVEFQVTLSGGCGCCSSSDGCKCGSEKNNGCQDCKSFNTTFTLWQTEEDPNRYRYDFPENFPCDAHYLELVLSNVASPETPKYLACVSLYFKENSSPRASWIKAGIDDSGFVGNMRSRSRSSVCCFPQTIYVASPPQPDYCAPVREWQQSDPDDLNDAVFFPKIDIEAPEDSLEVPVRYVNGELNLREKDLSSNGFGVPWGFTRIYSNRLSNNYDYGCGMNWMIHELPHLVPHKRVRKEYVNDELQEVTYRGIAFVRGTRNSLWFYEDSQDKDAWRDPEDRLVWNEMKPQFGQPHVLEHFEDERLFRLVQPNGHIWEVEIRANDATAYAKGFKGIETRTIDGSDFFESYKTIKEVFGKIRRFIIIRRITLTQKAAKKEQVLPLQIL